MDHTNSANQRKFTKIVATVSGDGCTRTLLQDLFDRGMNVMRMNSAHLSIEEMRRLVADARAVSSKLAVMIDTKGPNIRTCNLPPEGRPLKKDGTILLSGQPGSDDRIQVNYAAFAEEVPVGSRIVCDDGAVVLKVIGKTADCLQAQVLFDSTIKNRKSINVPDVSLHAPALTDKDRLFLAEAVKLQCDFVAHSFVRNAADVREVRQALGEAGKEIGIIAKIENREGVDHLEEILLEADGIMVARGDLGIEIPLEEVPAIQKKMIHTARKFAKPVITATQMLQSMEESPLPTRAEVSDVANAVYDGTDAVMLSGETAHGRFPREAVETMCRIVMEAERAPREFFPVLAEAPDQDLKAAYLLAAAVHSADFLPVKAIVCSTLGGKSAQVCSALRPRIPVFAPTPQAITMRKMALSYGVFAEQVSFDASPSRQALQAIRYLFESGEPLNDDDLVMLLGKISPELRRNNLLCLATIEELKHQ